MGTDLAASTVGVAARRTSLLLGLLGRSTLLGDDLGHSHGGAEVLGGGGHNGLLARGLGALLLVHLLLELVDVLGSLGRVLGGGSHGNGGEGDEGNVLEKHGGRRVVEVVVVVGEVVV